MAIFSYPFKAFKLTSMLMLLSFMLTFSFNAFAQQSKAPDFTREDMIPILKKLNLSKEQAAKIGEMLNKERERAFIANRALKELSDQYAAPDISNEQKEEISKQITEKKVAEEKAWYGIMMGVYLLLSESQAAYFKRSIPKFKESIESVEESGITNQRLHELKKRMELKNMKKLPSPR